MKKFMLIIALLLPAIWASAFTFEGDTTLQYRNRKVVIKENEKDNEMNVSVYRITPQGDTIKSDKLYEGIFTDDKSIERSFENKLQISIPNIFKPKAKRKIDRVHWDGFGIGFSNFAEGSNFNGELGSIVNVGKSLQYNLNLITSKWNLASNLNAVTGMGIQINTIRFQRNKSIGVNEDYAACVVTTEPGKEYTKSRLRYTYLTFPVLLETNIPIGGRSAIFLNAGVVVKVKTASSSKVWSLNSTNGKKEMSKVPESLNIRPMTFDIIAQAGIDDFGFFASYSPNSLFRDNKGPKGNQATVGIQLYF